MKYILIYNHEYGTDVYPFSSEDEGLGSLIYSGEDFASALEDRSSEEGAEMFEDNYPKWDEVKKVIAHFQLDFEPAKNEDIIIEECPERFDEIEL